jgi:RNA polymerase sigma factor (sigma-70 family)
MAEYIAEAYRRWGPAIYRRARFLLHNADEARDVAHDTFVAFMRSEDLLHSLVSPFTVLYQIATYKAVDRLRRRARWCGTLESLEVRDVEVSESGVERTLFNEGGLARVEALQDLALLTRGEKPQTLTAALLYYVEEHTIEEVAKVLGVSRKTASNLLRQFASRARKRSARFRSRGTL